LFGVVWGLVRLVPGGSCVGAVWKTVFRGGVRA